MKIDLLNYIVSILFISLILAFTLLTVIYSKNIVRFCAGSYYQIMTVGVFFLVYGILTAFFLRLVSKICPLKEGTYSMNHRQFTLWKVHAVVGELGRSALHIFFPVFLRPIYYALFGAKIGKNVAIGGKLVDPSLTMVGDFGVLGQDSVVTAHVITYDKFIIAPVVVRKKATVGVGAIIMPGVEVGENSVVAPGSVVLMNTKIPPNEVWGGIPARKIKG